MAGVYRVYTQRTSIPYTVVFRCEKCETQNVFLHLQNIESSYSDRGVWTKAGLEKRKAESSQRLAYKKQEEIREFENCVNHKNFRAIHLKAKCKNCGNCPTWAYSEFWSVFQKTAEVCAAIAILLLLLWLGSNLSSHSGPTESKDYIFLLVPLLFALPYAAFQVWRVVDEKQRKKKLQNIDPVYLPIIKRIKPKK